MPADVVLSHVDETARGQWRALLHMAVPTIGAGWLRSSYLLVDTWTAGRLSTPELGALSAAMFFAWMFHSLSAMVSIGALSVVARRFGAGDRSGMRRATRLALMLAVALGLLCSGALFVIAPRALSWMSLPDASLGPDKATSAPSQYSVSRTG